MRNLISEQRGKYMNRNFMKNCALTLTAAMFFGMLQTAVFAEETISPFLKEENGAAKTVTVDMGTCHGGLVYKGDGFNKTFSYDDVSYELKGFIDSTDANSYKPWEKFENVYFGDKGVELGKLYMGGATGASGTMAVYMDADIEGIEDEKEAYGQIKETGILLGEVKIPGVGGWEERNFKITSSNVSYTEEISGSHTLYLLSVSNAPGKITNFWFSEKSEVDVFSNVKMKHTNYISDGRELNSDEMLEGNTAGSYFGYDFADFGDGAILKDLNIEADLQNNATVAVVLDPSDTSDCDAVLSSGTVITEGLLQQGNTTGEQLLEIDYSEEIAGLHKLYIVVTSGSVGAIGGIYFGKCKWVINQTILSSGADEIVGANLYESFIGGVDPSCAYVCFKDIKFDKNNPVKMMGGNFSVDGSSTISVYTLDDSVKNVNMNTVMKQGELIGTINVRGSSWDKWFDSYSFDIAASPVGVHDIYLVFSGSVNTSSICFYTEDRIMNNDYSDGEKIIYPCTVGGNVLCGNNNTIMVSADGGLNFKPADLDGQRWSCTIDDAKQGMGELVVQICNEYGDCVFENRTAVEFQQSEELTLKSSVIEAGSPVKVTYTIKNKNKDNDYKISNSLIAALFCGDKLLKTQTVRISELGGGESKDICFDELGEYQNVEDFYTVVYLVDNTDNMSIIFKNIYPEKVLPKAEIKSIVTIDDKFVFSVIPDVNTGKINVTVSAPEKNSEIVLCVYDKNGECKFIGSDITNDENKAAFEFSINEVVYKEDYRITVYQNGRSEEKKFKLFSKQMVDNLLLLISKTETEALETVLRDPQNVEILNLSFDVYDLLDSNRQMLVLSKIAKKLFKDAEEINIAFNNASNEQFILDNISKSNTENADRLIKQYKNEIKINDNSFYYLLGDAASRFYDKYIFNVTYKDIEEFAKAFKDGSAIIYLNYKQKSEYVSEKIIENYSSELGLDKNDVVEYEQMSQTNKLKVIEYIKITDINELAEAAQRFHNGVVSVKQGSTSGNGSKANNSQGYIIASKPQTDENTNSASTKSYFSDLPQTHWAYQYMTALIEKNVISGMGNGCVEPDGEVKREQFLKMLLESLDITGSNAECAFTDVDTKDWYYKYVQTAVEHGIVSGYEDGSFGIGKNISRAEMCVLIQRAVSVTGKKLSYVNDEFDFTDSEAVPEFAKEAVSQLQRAGIVNGYEDGSFGADGASTRAAAATVIYKMLDNIDAM